MRADNSHHLIAAARHRSDLTRRRATAALRRMDATGMAITFESVAREARVSRSWLYTDPELRAEMERLRARHRTARRPVPDGQRASDASLLRRMEVAGQSIRALEAENRQLRQALAEALGGRRTEATRTRRQGTPDKTSAG